MNNIRNKLLEFLINPQDLEISVADFAFMQDDFDEKFMIDNWYELCMIVTFVYSTISKYNIFEEVRQICYPGVQKMINHPKIGQLMLETGETNETGKIELIGAFSIFCDSMDQFARLCALRPPYKLRYLITKNRSYLLQFNNPCELALFMLSRVKYSKKILHGYEAALTGYPKILVDTFGDRV